MNPLARIAPLALVLGLFAAPPWANAHSVWIEPGPDAALVVRFGEPGEEPERSPGHLDEFTLPVAFTLDTNGVSHVLATVKKEDHFAVTPAPATEVLGLETAYEVMGAPGKPGRMPLFYARWQPSGAAAGTPRPHARPRAGGQGGRGPRLLPGETPPRHRGHAPRAGRRRARTQGRCRRMAPVHRVRPWAIPISPSRDIGRHAPGFTRDARTTPSATTRHSPGFIHERRSPNPPVIRSPPGSTRPRRAVRLQVRATGPRGAPSLPIHERRRKLRLGAPRGSTRGPPLAHPGIRPARGRPVAFARNGPHGRRGGAAWSATPRWGIPWKCACAATPSR